MRHGRSQAEGKDRWRKKKKTEGGWQERDGDEGGGTKSDETSTLTAGTLT